MTAPSTPAAPSPLVTVVVPAYEVGEDIRPTLDSVLAQTLTDLEVLVVDDGSPTTPVPEDLPADPRLVVDRRPVNRGYAAVTNHAVARARGEWVVFVDADDIVEPTYVEVMVAAGEHFHADAVLAPLLCVRDGREMGTLLWDPPGTVSDGPEAMRRLLRNEIAGSQHLLLRRPRPDAPEELVYSDWVFLLRHLSRSTLVAYVEEPLYRYTIHGESISGGLHESVWNIAEVPDRVAPLLPEVFEPGEARLLEADMRQLTVSQMLHKAARERRDTPLRAEVTRWCRERMGLRGAAVLLRHGHRTDAASWLLALVSPALHRRAYQSYDRLKTLRHR